ncbi:DUF4062 domain-containing protein [uncultured Tolumonas sp.]|uniref:DUF4062 domain-containing protein n=1 Tax=uncultured Tolumonas sp. TaxID=263765 RepID=UPI002931DBAC|nr:DUF4062 domain-containing protein [uncultured Tolumonas sp.]
MPIGYKPAVFVSSTCYDLGQVRADIRDLIHSLGLEPVLSEYDSFPINTNLDTVSACLQNVRDKADIFILIVGGRYGFQTENGKSITNLEYLEAKKKGIPIYVFIAENIQNILPIWESNPDADFSSVVDSTKVFEFIKNLKHFSSNWVYSFSRAQNIKETLLIQIPYLFMDALTQRKRLTALDIKTPSEKYNPESVRIIVEKPKAWEYLLFSELLMFYYNNLQEKRLDLKYQISFGKKTKIENPSDVISLISDKNDELASLVSLAEKSVNVVLIDALGPDSVAGDAEHIQYACQKIVDIYNKILDWKLSFNNLLLSDNIENDFRRIINIISDFAIDPIEKIELFINQAYTLIREALVAEKPTEVNLKLSMAIRNIGEFQEESERIKKLFSPA